VLDVYGTSETKEVAWECPAGSLHVNADVLRLEVLDESGRPLPADAEGEIVVTSLVNRAMPLLRYRTGDRGTLRAGRCPCGLDLPLLGIVTGREVDHIQLPGGRRVSPYAFTCGLEPIPGMLRFQVVQIEPARLRVRARVARVARDEAPAAIRSAVLRAADAALSVEVELVDRFDERPGRKFQVVRALSRGDRDGEGRSKEPAG
jgi:phenylacetate-CoA ligase